MRNIQASRWLRDRSWVRCLLPVVLPLAINACTVGEKHAPGGPFYFASWTGYSFPRKPREPISEQEAKARGNYYEAFFDSEGRLVSFTKYLGGMMKWKDEYEYQEKGISRRTIRASGEIQEELIEP